MSNWTSKIPEAARDFLAGRRLDEVERIVPDIAGVARGKAMPACSANQRIKEAA